MTISKTFRIRQEVDPYGIWYLTTGTKQRYGDMIRHAVTDFFGVDRVPYARGYRVRYTLDSRGPYTVAQRGLSSCLEGDHPYRTLLVCMLPKGWRGRQVRRTVLPW